MVDKMIRRLQSVLRGNVMPQVISNRGRSVACLALATLAVSLPPQHAMAQASESTQIQRGPSVTMPRTTTRPGRGSPLDRLSDRPAPTVTNPANIPARTLPALAPGRPGSGSIEHFPAPMRAIIQDQRGYVSGWNDAYRYRRDQENPIYGQPVLPPDGNKFSTNFFGHSPTTGALVARQSLKSEWSRPEARPPVRQHTVNDYIFRHEYILYRYGVNIANPFTFAPLCHDPNAPIDSVMLEPVDINSLYPGLSAVQSQQITASLSTAPLSSTEAADQQFRTGQLASTVEAYKQHLSLHPEDDGTKVRLSLALLDAGEIADGMALLHLVYSTDPQFAATSFRDIAPAWPTARIRAAVRRSVDQANRSGSASAWMTVALLMEAEGRVALASQMIERAASNGLDPMIYAQIKGVIEASSPSSP
jgi:hypothetical protein